MSSTDLNFQGYGAAASQWSIINSLSFKSCSTLIISPAVLNSVDNVANIVNSGVADISDAISEQQRQLDCESEWSVNVRLLSVLQRQSAPESLTGCHQSISFFAKQIFPMCGSQEPVDGCLQIHTFKSGKMSQGELSGAAEFVRGLHSSSTTSNLSTYIAGAGKTVLTCDTS
jgi:hypothetical protein